MSVTIGHGRWRRSRRTASATFLALAWTIPGSLAAQVPRLFDPQLEEPLYDLVETVLLRTGSGPSNLTVKPWTSRDLTELLTAVDSAAQSDSASLPEWMLDPIRVEVRSVSARAPGHAGLSGLDHMVSVVPRLTAFAAAGEHELEPGFRSIRERHEEGDPDAGVGGEIHLGYAWWRGGLSGVLDLRGRTNTRNAFDYRRRDEDGSVEARSAYLLWEGSRHLFALGRLPLEWGSGPLGGVGLTAVGPTLDGLLARARIGAAQLTVLNALLPAERANRRLGPDGNTIASSSPDENAPSVNRFFHAHRVDLEFGESFTIGVNEMALVTGVRRRPDLQFMSGLVPYYVAQNSREEIDGNDINLGTGLQYRWRLPGRVLLYGEYFANEIFLDAGLGEVIRGLGGRRQNTQGFQQGIRWAAPLGWRSIDLEAEVVRLDSFLYLHRGLSTNWRRGDVPLGAPLGPDNARALVGVKYYRPLGRGLFRGMARIIRRERGIGRITDNDDIQSAGRQHSFPREPVETSWLGTVGAEFWWPRLGRTGIVITSGRVENANNIVEESLEPIDVEFYMSIGPAWDDAF